MARLLLLRPSRQLVFLLLAAAIYFVDSFALRMAPPSRRILVAAGASVDLVLVVGLLYYWLLVRPGLRPRAGVVFIAGMGLLRASFLFPEGAWLKILFGVCAELGLLTYVVVQVSRSRKEARSSADPLAAVRKAVAAVIPFPAGARAIATEVSLFYYALFGWRAKADVPEGARAFWLFEQTDTASLLATVALATLFEIIPVHLLASRWSPLTAWILTALGVYSMVWLLGLSRALVLRPTLAGSDFLDLRYGMIARLRVPQSEIAGIGSVSEPSAGVVVLPRRAVPNVQISFRQPQKLERLFGSREVTGIALRVEDEAGFLQALRSESKRCE